MSKRGEEILEIELEQELAVEMRADIVSNAVAYTVRGSGRMNGELVQEVVHNPVLKGLHLLCGLRNNSKLPGSPFGYLVDLVPSWRGPYKLHQLLRGEEHCGTERGEETRHWSLST